MPRLYSLSEHMMDVRDLLLESADDGGEGGPEMLEMLATAEGDWRQKIEPCARVVCDLEAEQAAYKAHGDRLTKLARAIGKNAERLKEYVRGEMERCGMEKVDCIPPVAIRKNPPAVWIVDEKLIPANYWIPQEPELSKMLIADELKAGGSVPGAEMRRGTRLAIG